MITYIVTLTYFRHFFSLQYFKYIYSNVQRILWWIFVKLNICICISVYWKLKQKMRSETKLLFTVFKKILWWILGLWKMLFLVFWFRLSVRIDLKYKAVSCHLMVLTKKIVFPVIWEGMFLCLFICTLSIRIHTL